ncbi:3-deoxy-D-manno-octulosonic acid transferase [Lampropedia puyangensis]|uniref:3-deoxy-D-manno-octulosonic acid transferase n=1 Tax=Lampropedia puyangensis TaxID=1330072 RepID=A0A4V4GRU0_9BURK|nr:3-deoxy-D-manno-octulosonic acid transferase [Lampropedia puyangensis]THU02866.1 3-deoxy-D-manno-octulosonic acid transferase [Lampropedia puyangensis]
MGPTRCAESVRTPLRWVERVALAVYGVAISAASPLLRKKLRKRALKEPGYGEHVSERFGFYKHEGNNPAQSPERAPNGPLLWVHAVSLGETRTAGLLLGALRARIPGLRILLTHGTATGREEGRKYLREGDLQAWFPWDSPRAVRRFLAHFRPQMGVLMETEVWPHMVQGCANQGVPLWLVNARLNEKSLQGIQKTRWLMGPAYRDLAGVFAQTSTDADRLQSVGASVLGITGNIKFDAQPDAQQVALGLQMRREYWQRTGKTIVVLASSREGEEAAWLDAIVQNKLQQTVQWMVVPRHPQRFAAVASLVEAKGLTLARRSAWGVMQAAALPTHANVWLGDSMGEMALYYSMADVALLGASFESLGGQNLIEACACACPVVMGPYTFNFTQAAVDALEHQAAIRVNTMPEAVAVAVQLAHDSHRLPMMQEQALAFAQAHRGALDALASHLTNLWLCRNSGNRDTPAA